MVPSQGMVAPQRQFVTGAGCSENLLVGSPSVARTWLCVVRKQHARVSVHRVGQRRGTHSCTSLKRSALGSSLRLSAREQARASARAPSCTAHSGGRAAPVM